MKFGSWEKIGVNKFFGMYSELNMVKVFEISLVVAKKLVNEILDFKTGPN